MTRENPDERPDEKLPPPIDTTEEGAVLGETELVQTSDEDGNIHSFEKVSEFEVDGRDYALLIYLGEGTDIEAQESDGHDEEVVAMRLLYEDGLEVYESIDDEDEFERVVTFLEEYDEDEVTIDVEDIVKAMEAQGDGNSDGEGDGGNKA